jgi:hypothetical protein
MNEWLITYKNRLLLAFSLLCIIFHISLQLTYQVNIPENYDDNIICLEEYMQYLDGDVSLGKYLLSRKNNHRTFVQRSLVHLGYVFTGEVNFQLLAFLANAGFLLFGLWFIWIYRSNRLVFLLPMLLYAPIAKYLTWFSAAAAYSYSLIFFYLIAYLLTQSGSRIKFILTLLLLPLLTVTFGNSIVGLFFLLAWSVYLAWIKKLDRTRLSIFISVVLLSTVLYFIGYSPIGLTNYNLLEIGPFALAFAGSIVKYLFIQGTLPALSLSVFCLIYMIFIFFRNRKDVDTGLPIVMALYVLGSGLAAGSGRCPSIFCNPLADRYELFSVFFFLMFVLLIGKHSIRIGYLLAIISIVLTVNKYYVNKNELDTIQYKNELIKREAYFTDFFEINAARKVWRLKNNEAMQNAQSRGLANFSIDPQDFIISSSFNNCSTLTPADAAIKQIRHKGNYSFIKGRLGAVSSHLYFLKNEQGCLTIQVHFDPKRGQLGNFYTIVPRVDESEVEIFMDGR